MKILIVEDNKELAKSMQRVLHHEAVSKVVNDGNVAMAEIEDSYDMVLLDLNLPHVSGLEICQYIRAQKLTMPILIITGLAKTKAVVELLDAGADDYIIKPFSVPELQARVRALARRNTDQAVMDENLEFEDLVLDTNRHQAVRNGTEIPLRNKEYFILEELMRHPGMVLSRALLIDRAWDHDENTWGNPVDVQINHLRDKIDRPFGTDTIETVHGVGYRLRKSKSNVLK